MQSMEKYTSILLLGLLAAPLHERLLLDSHPSTMAKTAEWVREGLIGLGPRQEHSVAVVDRTIYVVGGVVHNDVYPLVTTARVESFDVEQHQWSVPAPLPHPVNHVNLASVDGKLYSLGGLTGESPEDPVWLAVPKCNKYDPVLTHGTPSLLCLARRGVHQRSACMARLCMLLAA